jgi:hypothetical protein
MDFKDFIPGWGWEFHEPPYAEPADRQIQSGELQGELRTGKLWDYTGKSKEVYRCPNYTARKVDNPRFWGFNQTVPALAYPLWSYTINGQAAMSSRPDTDSTLDIKIGALHTPPATTLLCFEPQNNNGYDNGVTLFSGLMPPENQDHLGTTYHADVGSLVFFDGHAISMTWRQYTNACSGLENAKQFFGGSYEFRW